jgi:integration host factor subunit beta
MKSLNETIKTLNFDSLDSEIMASTGKDEVTYKKDTVSQLVLESFEEEGFSRQDAAGMVNNFVDFLKAQLLEGTALIFTGHGRLIPRLKEGGRPVRDLSRSTSIEMKTTATITFSKTQKCQGEKISTRRIVKDFIASQIEQQNSAILAELTAEMFIALIHRTKIEGRRMEVRGLGVFRSTLVESREGRNPKTGEATHIPATSYPRFRISTPFRKELTESLAK